MPEEVDPLKAVPAAVRFRSGAPAHKIIANDVAEMLATVAGDVTLLLDPDGRVRDMAFGDGTLSETPMRDWLGNRWIDTVTVESRPKIEALLAAGDPAARWRQVNHPIDGADMPVRYVTLDAGKPGWLLAVGRDLRATAALQQRLLQSQQAIERDYIRLRQAEARYRLLFAESVEAILVVDGGTRRITEANPAAAVLLHSSVSSLENKPVTSLFQSADREAIVSLFGSVAAAENVDPIEARLAGTDLRCTISASLFRHGRGASFLVRLASGSVLGHATAADARLADILNRMPDAFVVTDEDLVIMAENPAFLEMTQFARKEQVRGEPLSRFLGRPAIDLTLLTAQLREHGSVRNFETVMRDRFDVQEDVSVTAVRIIEGGEVTIGLTIRTVARNRESRPPGESVTRSVEQLTDLVGRVSLKEIVRESTDLIERLCIEAALAHTSDNRASAAEILGLSRQSLYSKLHRHGLANGAIDTGPFD